MPPSTSAPSASASTPLPSAASSIAADLGAQYRKLYEFEAIDLSQHVPGAPASPLAIVPEGKALVSLKEYIDEYRLVPERRDGTAHLFDSASFIALTNRFKQPGVTAVFAKPEREAPSFTTVFDYHGEGPEITNANALDHRASYAPQLSAEWKA
jgi:hypothetical protein